MSFIVFGATLETVGKKIVNKYLQSAFNELAVGRS